MATNPRLGPALSRWKRCSQIFLSRQREKRRWVFFQSPYWGGKSRHGAPVLRIHSTALTNRRLSLAICPRDPVRPGNTGSMTSHWASVRSCRWQRGIVRVFFMRYRISSQKTTRPRRFAHERLRIPTREAPYLDPKPSVSRGQPSEAGRKGEASLPNPMALLGFPERLAEIEAHLPRKHGPFSMATPNGANPPGNRTSRGVG